MEMVNTGSWHAPSDLLKTDYSWYGVGLIVIHDFARNLNNQGQIVLAFWLSAQYNAVFALLPIHFYNGQRGLSLRYLFFGSTRFTYFFLRSI
jgi:hypothetical protein